MSLFHLFDDLVRWKVPLPQPKVVCLKKLTPDLQRISVGREETLGTNIFVIIGCLCLNLQFNSIRHPRKDLEYR